MSILDFFRGRPTRTGSATQAKERLQILLAHERVGAAQPDYLPRLHRDLLEVIGRYMQIDEDKVNVKIDHLGSVSTLEVNIELPEQELEQRAAV